jgi:hypothetical protein
MVLETGGTLSSHHQHWCCGIGAFTAAKMTSASNWVEQHLRRWPGFPCSLCRRCMQQRTGYWRELLAGGWVLAGGS